MGGKNIKASDKAKTAAKAAAAKKEREDRLSQLDRTPPKRGSKEKVKSVHFSPVTLSTRRRRAAEDDEEDEDGAGSDVAEAATSRGSKRKASTRKKVNPLERKRPSRTTAQATTPRSRRA
jgi:hypothetical protein